MVTKSRFLSCFAKSKNLANGVFARFGGLINRWQGQKGSNPRHAVLETAALPAELYPYFMVDHQGLEPRTNRL